MKSHFVQKGELSRKTAYHLQAVMDQVLCLKDVL